MGSKRNWEQRKGIIEPSHVERARRALKPKVVTLQLELVVLQQKNVVLRCASDDGSVARKVAQNA
jgi:hypothetical protein